MSAQPLEAVHEWLDSPPILILCGKRIPPRPSAPKVAPPDLSWQPEAACRDVPAATSAAFTDAVTQADGSAAAQEWCTHCPVAEACLTYGRSYWAWGLQGGMVLLDGKVAPRTAEGLSAP